MEAFRTPEGRFDGLPDFPFEPRYREVEGLRLAHIDEGDGAPVVFLHGEPTWSYLWRKVIPPVRAAGYRCIAPDHPGFGRSDKPTDLGWYSYDRHCELAATLLADLELSDATVVVHDWGGPIGLRLAVEHPERIARMVIMDTGLFTGKQSMSVPGRRSGTSSNGPRTCRSDPRQGRLRPRDRRRGDRRLRRAVSGSRGEGRRARVPAHAAHDP